MSSEALGWVYRHSPYKGATFAVHLAIADSVNDMHGWELWASQETIAAKARVSRSTASERINELVASGYLELLSDHQSTNAKWRPGKANRYRLLMPDGAPDVFTYRAQKDVPSGDTSGVSRAGTPPKQDVPADDTPQAEMSREATSDVPSGDTNPKNPSPQDQPKQTPRVPEDDSVATSIANKLADAIASLPGVTRPTVDHKWVTEAQTLLATAGAATPDGVRGYEAIRQLIQWTFVVDPFWRRHIGRPSDLTRHFRKMWQQYVAEQNKPKRTGRTDASVGKHTQDGFLSPEAFFPERAPKESQR